jgi:hypothetical protein
LLLRFCGKCGKIKDTGPGTQIRKADGYGEGAAIGFDQRLEMDEELFRVLNVGFRGRKFDDSSWKRDTCDLMKKRLPPLFFNLYQAQGLLRYGEG